jgi:tripartite-type tricarboxylate transporter receptor subunit TctC
MKTIIRLLCAMLLATVGATYAQSYPTKPIKLIVPFAPGGVADIVSRTVAPRLAEGLGQAMVVENKPSAGGILAAEAVARADPDGHTVLLITNGNAISSALFNSLPYDPVNDFAMISTIGFFGLVIVTDPASPVKSVQDLIATAKAKPGTMNLGTIGAGSTQHLAAELFRSTAGIDVQVVTYKATPEVFAGIKNRDIHATFEFIAPVIANIRAGNLRAVAVTAGQRFAGLPDTPTVMESGLAGFNVASWNGLAVPAKTSRAIIDRLHHEAVKALALPEVQKRFFELGVEARSMTPEAMRDFFLSEQARWTRVIERAAIPKR